MDLAPPQGIYAAAVHPLDAGEVWVQHIEVFGLSGQAGLGKGFDVSLGYIGVLPQQNDLLNLGVGYGRSFPHDLHVHVGAGGGGSLQLVPDVEVKPLAMVSAGLAWGTRARHVAINTHVARAYDGWLIVSEIDAVLPAGRFGAVLFGLADVVYPGFRGDLTHALCTGPSYRHHFGPFSVDLGVQGFFGPGVYPTDALGNSPITPVPTLLLRYGFPGRR